MFELRNFREVIRGEIHGIARSSTARIFCVFKKVNADKTKFRGSPFISADEAPVSSAIIIIAVHEDQTSPRWSLYISFAFVRRQREIIFYIVQTMAPSAA